MKVTATTLIIKPETGEYPVSLDKVRTDTKASFALEPDSLVLEHLGYAVVTPTTRPVADVVDEAAPIKVGNVWTQQWSPRSYTAAEIASLLAARKAALAAQVNNLRVAKLNEGFQFDFGGEWGLKTVQLRDDDKINIVALRTIANAYVDLNMASAQMEFRTAENVNVRVEATVIINMSNAAFQRVNDVYSASWFLKDQIDAATTLAELPEMPATLDV